jgi:hypothetical protein
MDPADQNQSPPEEKKSDNPEHINIKVPSPLKRVSLTVGCQCGMFFPD